MEPDTEGVCEFQPNSNQVTGPVSFVVGKCFFGVGTLLSTLSWNLTFPVPGRRYPFNWDDIPGAIHAAGGYSVQPGTCSNPDVLLQDNQMSVSVFGVADFWLELFLGKTTRRPLPLWIRLRIPMQETNGMEKLPSRALFWLARFGTSLEPPPSFVVVWWLGALYKNQDSQSGAT